MPKTNPPATAPGQYPSNLGQRSTMRVAVSFTAKLREQGHSSLDVIVHDLSTHGFQVDTVYRLRPETLVWLQVPGLQPLPARVKWFRDYRIGCAFDEPLHSAVHERIISVAAAQV